MTPGEFGRLAWEALRAHRMRTRMTYAALAIGVGSVLVLTGLGEGARGWVEDRFASLGSNLLVAMPGRTETRGGPPLAASTTRDLTLADMHAVSRRMAGVLRAVPVVVGEATAQVGRRGRAAFVVGTAPGYLEIRDIPVTRGAGLPEIEDDQAARVCVIGRILARDLFGEANPVGGRLRLGEYPFRVVGVIAQRGESMMVNLDEVVLVPVASAMKIFNQTTLFRLLVQVHAADLERGAVRLRELLKDRHDGEEDFTVLTPGSLAASFGRIIDLITLGLAGIAAISLMVAGIGVMNVMLVSVTERTGEVGLMKAVGASDRQVLAVFLAEAVALSLVGGLLGIAGGVALVEAARAVFPWIPFRVPAESVLLASGTSLGIGILFGLLPARKAARMEPLDALRRKV